MAADVVHNQWRARRRCTEPQRIVTQDVLFVLPFVPPLPPAINYSRNSRTVRVIYLKIMRRCSFHFLNNKFPQKVQRPINQSESRSPRPFIYSSFGRVCTTPLYLEGQRISRTRLNSPNLHRTHSE